VGALFWCSDLAKYLFEGEDALKEGVGLAARGAGGWWTARWTAERGAEVPLQHNHQF
jgi:hypothetical protein